MDFSSFGNILGIGLPVSQELQRHIEWILIPVADTDARVIEVRIRLCPEDGGKVAGLSYARAHVVIESR